MANSLAPRTAQKGLQSVVADPAIMKRFQEVLGNRAPAYIRSVITTVNNNSKLKRCEPMTVLTCAMKSATMDLEPDTNLGYVAYVPRQIKGVWQAQFQMTAKGITQLGIRTGQYKTINVGEIYEDEFDGTDIITGELKWHPVQGGQRDNGETDKIAGYFAYFRLVSGFEKTEFWTTTRVRNHAMRFSKSYNDGPWQTNFDAMAKKTVLKYALTHYGLLSVEMQKAIVEDQSTQQGFDAVTEYSDNPSFDDILDVDDPSEAQEATVSAPEAPQAYADTTGAQKEAPAPSMEEYEEV